MDAIPYAELLARGKEDDDVQDPGLESRCHGGIRMRVILHRINQPQEDMLDLSVSVGGASAKSFSAHYDSNSGHEWCGMEEGLFMRLSGLALQRYGDCTVYQTELMGIVRAFVKGEPLPPFPIELGTTQFGFRRPGPFRVLWNRVRRLLYRLET